MHALIIIFFFSVNAGTHVLVELQNAQTFPARNYLSVWIAIERAVAPSFLSFSRG